MKGDRLIVKTDRGFEFYVTEDNESDCRSCGERILWCITERGKRMPVDPPDPPDEPTVSHFATCQDADMWRKPRTKESDKQAG